MQIVEQLQRLQHEQSHFKTNVTVREFKDGKAVATFKSTTVPEIITEWCKRRVELETRALNYQLSQLEDKVAKTRLMILAVDNRKQVLACLDATDPDKALSKALKITLDQAKQILDLQVRRLSKMDGEHLNNQLQQLLGQIKGTKAWLKKPAAKVVQELDAIFKALTL